MNSLLFFGSWAWTIPIGCEVLVHTKCPSWGSWGLRWIICLYICVCKNLKKRASILFKRRQAFTLSQPSPRHGWPGGPAGYLYVFNSNVQRGLIVYLICFLLFELFPESGFIIPSNGRIWSHLPADPSCNLHPLFVHCCCNKQKRYKYISRHHARTFRARNLS